MEDCEQDYTYDSEEEGEECEIEDGVAEEYPPFCFGFGHGVPGRGGHKHGPPPTRHGPMWGLFGRGTGHPHSSGHWRGAHTRGHPKYMHGPYHPHPHGPPAHHPHGLPAHHPHGPPPHHPHGPPPHHPHGPPPHHPHHPHGPHAHHPHGPPPPPMFGDFRKGGRGRGKCIQPWNCRWGVNEEGSADNCCKTGSWFPGCECGVAGEKPANDIYIYLQDFAPEELKVKISNDNLIVTCKHVEENQQTDDTTDTRQESMTHVYHLPKDKKVDRTRIKAKVVCSGRFLRIKVPYKKLQVPIEREDDDNPIPEMEGITKHIITKD